MQAAWAKAAERGDRSMSSSASAAPTANTAGSRPAPSRCATRPARIVKWFGSNTDVEDYKRAEDRLRTQLERCNLLDQITRAIGERQDLRSIFQVVDPQPRRASAGRFRLRLPLRPAQATR